LWQCLSASPLLKKTKFRKKKRKKKKNKKKEENRMKKRRVVGRGERVKSKVSERRSHSRIDHFMVSYLLFFYYYFLLLIAQVSDVKDPKN